VSENKDLSVVLENLWEPNGKGKILEVITSIESNTIFYKTFKQELKDEKS